MSEQQPFSTHPVQAPLGGSPASPKSNVVAALAQFFLGGFGIGNFYAGYSTRGIIQLVLTVVAFVLDFFLIGLFVHAAVGLWALVESILYLFKVGSYARDAQGNPFA